MLRIKYFLALFLALVCVGAYAADQGAQFAKTGLSGVSGAQTVSGALVVQGAVTAQTTLGVTGISTLAACTIQGNITIDDGVTDSPTLTFKDATDETAVFLKKDGALFTLTTSASEGLQMIVGNLYVGNGTPGVNVPDGEDFYCEGTSEFDGVAQFDGAATFAANFAANNTAGGTFNLGNDNTLADTITIGSAKDTVAVAGISMTVGSTGTTSATTVQSGTGDLALTSTDDISLTVATAVTDNITLTANTSTQATAISLSATAGTVKAAGDQLDIDTTNDSNFTVTSSTDGEDMIFTQAGANDSSILFSVAGTGVDAFGVTATAGTAAISANKLDLDGTDDIDLTLTSNADAEDMTISLAGNQNSSILISSAGSGADSLSLSTVTNGGDLIVSSNDKIDMDSVGTFALNAAGDTLLVQVDADGAADDLTIKVAGNQDASLILSSEGSGTDSITIMTETNGGDIVIKSNDNLDIGSNAVAQDITIGNETGASSLALKAGSGNINVQGVPASTITIGDAAQTAAITIGASTDTMTDLSLGTGVGAHTIHIGDGGTAAQVVTIGSTSAASAVTVQSGTADVTVTSADDFVFTATDDISLSSNSAGGVIGIGDGNDGYTINVGTDNTAADTITIGSAKDTTTITGTLNVTTPTTMEYLLSSTAGVDVNAAANTTLYTVPSGKNCVITKIVIRGASASFNQAQDPQLSFGWDANATDVIANQTYTAPTAATTYLVMNADGKTSATESTRGQATETFDVKVNTTSTNPTTCTVDVFGYLY